MTELRQLVNEYITGTIVYADFRRAMVERFQSVRNTDQTVQNTVNAIADASADYSEGLLTEDQLKENLSQIVQQAGQVTVQNYTISIYGSGSYVRTGSSIDVLARGVALGQPFDIGLSSVSV